MAKTTKMYEEGERLMAAGDIKSAEATFKCGFEEDGDVRCSNRLGLLYDTGFFKRTDPNFETGAMWYEKGAAAKNAEAMAHLGIHYYSGMGVVRDYDRAFELLRDGESAEVPVAVRCLGLCFLGGLGVGVNKEEALRLFGKAYELGDVHSGYILGECYFDEEDVKKDEALALGYITKAAERGDADAQLRLSEFYLMGMCGLDVDHKKTAEWTKKAAEQGSVTAQFNYGYYLANGVGVEMNREEAFEWNMCAAKNNFPEAQYQAAKDYTEGVVVEKDQEEAAKWCKLAADSGFVSAKYSLGVNYMFGQGVKKDYAEAEKLFLEAARSGHLLAVSHLGMLYVIGGDGIKKDEKKAFKCWKNAADRGEPGAMNNLAICYKKGVGTAVDFKKAFEYCEKAAQKGDAAAQINLACSYVSGDIVEADIGRAVALLNEYAENGNGRAVLYLGELYYFGDAVKKNTRLGLSWFKKAADMGDVLAMYELGLICESGDADFIDTESAKALFLRVTEKYGAGDITDANERKIVARSYFMLAGLVELSGLDDMEALAQRRDYYVAADRLGYECKSSILAIDRAINLYSSGVNPEENAFVRLSYGLKKSEISLNDVYFELKKIISARFGKLWDVMREDVKKSLLTAFYHDVCNNSSDVMRHGDIDYSSVVLDICKTLDIYLRGIFGESYVAYLQNRESSASASLTAEERKNLKKEIRRASNNVRNYQITLGKMKDIAGLDSIQFGKVKPPVDSFPDGETAEEKRHTTINEYILEYLDEEVLTDEAFPGEGRRDDITDFVYSMYEAFSKIAFLFRNPSAHGDRTVSLDEVMRCEDAVVLGDEAVLVKLVSVLKPKYL